MRVGIDASNTRAGGTVTYLIELLGAANPAEHGISEVIVWAGSAVLNRLPQRAWLRKSAQPALEQAANPYHDRRHLQRAWWQRFQLPKLAAAERCDLLFAPGGVHHDTFHPVVTMSQNMLPFEEREAARYGVSLTRLRFWLLRRMQSRGFRSADGVIFLTEYARRTISRVADIRQTATVVIAHGVNPRFCFAPREQAPVAGYSAGNAYRILYVSTIDRYKHQWNVVRAVAQLRQEGFPVELDLVGPAYRASARRLAATIAELGAAAFVRCPGAVPYDRLQEYYAAADLKVFASSCENLPIILIEAMAAGLPIACSDRGPMPDVLGESGLYFDPEQPEQIAAVLRTYLLAPELRADKAQRAHAAANQYSWSRCAHETFSFLAQIGSTRSS
jgi:glycosyltransferase involved in cell wall biosynthesis